jgi:ribonuclease D
MRVLTTRDELQAARTALEASDRYYLDTEFDSSRHGTTLSLLQISNGAETWVIDALTVGDLAPLREALCRPNALWVLHAGSQDIDLVLRALGAEEAPRLLDTQVAWSFIGPEWGVSLAFLQYCLLGVRTAKAFQADDWLRRPLPREQLLYAAQDVAHLPALEAQLRSRANELGREHWLETVCRDVLRPTREPEEPLTTSSFRNAWQLDGRGYAALSLLVSWYNEQTSETRAGLNPKTLLAIAARLPGSQRDLEAIKGVPRRCSQEHGARLVRLVASAQSEPDRLEVPAPYARFSDLLLEARLNLLKIQVCAHQSIAPDLGLPASLMRRLLTRALQGTPIADLGATLGGWRGEILKDCWSLHAARLPD